MSSDGESDEWQSGRQVTEYKEGVSFSTHHAYGCGVIRYEGLLYTLQKRVIKTLISEADFTRTYIYTQP